MRLVDALLADGTISPPTSIYRTTRGTCDVCCQQVDGVCDCADKPSVIVCVSTPALSEKVCLIWITRNGRRTWSRIDLDLAVQVWGLVKVYQWGDGDSSGRRTSLS